MPVMNDKKPRTRDEIRTSMHEALRNNDSDAYSKYFDELMERIFYDLREEYDQRYQQLQNDMDARVLQQRGANLLTSEEKSFYQKLGECIRAKDWKQAISNANLIIPETTINRVFEELQNEHPLLSAINFMPTGGAVKIVLNTNGQQSAVWGTLCAEIVTELTAGFATISTNLCKLSAFLPVCKEMLELGPEWLDSFVRQTLYEAFANGAEAGFYDGTGKDQPIGMTRQVGAGVTVVDGVYPRKAKTSLTDLAPETVGNLLSLMAVDANGKPRLVRGVIFVVNPQDYLKKVMPATTIMGADGTYRNDVMPYPMRIIPCAAVPVGDAVMGLGYRYLGMLGSERDGRIEYSDHAKFLEDLRVYLIKGYANGLPLDNNAFVYLDVSGLQPLRIKVTVVDERELSDVATLASLKIGNKALTPTFAANTTSYEAATTDATNTVTAVPTDAGASVIVELNGAVVPNGSAVTWSSANSGVNTLTVTVTAEDGTTQKTYTVTVTKS